ncbi:MAG: hypothetical protein J6I42_07305 [Clostridia bacterium]|nr:hypothetical protein [Clostridia bacterium]MBO5257106.1 hypothetical protein [Clostridia bacterium]
MKTIENLFFGNEIPFELPPLDREEYHRLVEELDEFEDPLLEQLTKEQRQLYEDCQDIRMDISIAQMRDAFVRGFRMGVRIILDVVREPEKKTAK